MSGLGASVAANRGASGIDGVLSSAAGFAFGLNRGVTLVVGDISFLHDINGLCLLRSGRASAPAWYRSGSGPLSYDHPKVMNDSPDSKFTQACMIALHWQYKTVYVTSSRRELHASATALARHRLLTH